jgi:predicted nucleotidyltransferase component of viral defense system
MEQLRSSKLTEGNERLVLGGGHGVRSYLPRELQRFSIDLDFYCNTDDLSTIKSQLDNLKFTYVGYGVTEDGMFKRYDAPIPAGFFKGTLAFTRTYQQQFKLGAVPPEFYVTVCNDLKIEGIEMRRPRSYIPIDYVKEDVPVLPAEVIIASKIRILNTRQVKDLYKDLFDIHALYENFSVKDDLVVNSLKQFAPKISEHEVHERIKHASHVDEARRAIKLPKNGSAILNNWKEVTTHLRTKVITLLKDASCLG